MLDILQTYFGKLLTALGFTLVLTLWALLFALVIGLFFALLNVSHSRVLRFIGTLYVDMVRGVPLIVLAFFVYFGVPQGVHMMGESVLASHGGVLPALAEGVRDPLWAAFCRSCAAYRLTALQAGTAALAMNCGAYMAEIFRAGIQSIDHGQMEAARSLGLSYPRSMYRVVLPQAFRVMIPSIINQFIITLKDTSILTVIGYPELTNAGKSVVANTFKSLETWAIVGVMYMIVIVSLSKLALILERRLKRGRA